VRKQLANYPCDGIFLPVRAAARGPHLRRKRRREGILCAGDVNDDHAAVEVVVLVGGKARSAELICHDDFVVVCLRSQKSGHLTPHQGTAIQARSRIYFTTFGAFFYLKY
jgi:hypothetical protein